MYTEHLRIPVGVGFLHVERTGRGGPPVILLHGYGTCTFLWRAIAPQLADAGYTVVALDLLGYGESDRPANASYGMAAQAEYIARALSALRLSEVAIVGQDVGGLVGLLLAAQRPSRVRQVALLSPPDIDDLPGPDIRALQRATARAALSSNALFGALPLLEPFLQGAVSELKHMPDRLVGRYLAPFVGGDGVAQLLWLASAVELSDEELGLLAQVQTPVTLVRGERDQTSHASGLPRLEARLVGAVSTTVTIADAGRLIGEDQPVALATALLSWLERRPVTAPLMMR